MKRACVRIVTAALFLGATYAAASEPAWWTTQKRACNLSPGLAYETWRAQGFPCNGSGGGVNDDDDDDDRRARLARFRAQVQRQIEEQARREAERKRKGDEADNAGLEEASRGNWQAAADHFIEALRYTPERWEIQQHLEKANRELADIATAEQIADLRARIQDAINASGIEAMRQQHEDELNAQRIAMMIADFRSQSVAGRKMKPQPLGPGPSNSYPAIASPQSAYLRLLSMAHPIPANSAAAKVIVSKQEQIRRIDDQLRRTQSALRQLIRSGQTNEQLILDWQKESEKATIDAYDLSITLAIDLTGAHVDHQMEAATKNSIEALANRRRELARIQQELRLASKTNDLRTKIRDFSMDEGRKYTEENLWDVLTQFKKFEDMAGPSKDLIDAAYTIYRQAEAFQVLSEANKNGESTLRAANLLQQQVRKLLVQRQQLKATAN